MFVYIAEGSTPFLHICWLLYKLRKKDSNVFKFFAMILLASFFVFRVVMSPCLLFHLIANRSSWGMGSELLFALNAAIVSLFTVLNFFWFHKLVSLNAEKSSSVDKVK
jgi:predicted permease